MASSHCRPAIPCRCQLRRPATLQPARRADSRKPARQRAGSDSKMDSEAAGEENALLRSGPLRPAFTKEVLISDVRVSSVRILKHDLRRRSRRLQTYTGLPIQNRASPIKWWMK